MIWFISVNFPKRLIQLRKKHRLTQQALADATGLHVNQVKRYEAGTAQPTLETLVKLAKNLHVSLDQLVFDDADRGPDDEFVLQFEALKDFSAEERKAAKLLLESLILKHDSSRFARQTQ